LQSPEAINIALARYGYVLYFIVNVLRVFDPLNAELNPICHLLAALGTHLILHVRRIRFKVYEISMNAPF